MKLDFIKDLAKKYNLEVEVIIKELLSVMKEVLNVESLFIKNNRIYETYVNKDGEYKERKLKLTKAKIDLIIEKLSNKLLYLSNKLLKEKIYNKFSDRVVDGEIIGENEYCFFIKIKECKLKGFLYKSKKHMKKKWSIGDKGLFYIEKVILDDNVPRILLNDYSIKIDEYIIKNNFSYFFKKIIFLKDKIIIKSYPKLSDNDKKKVELIFNKKVIN